MFFILYKIGHILKMSVYIYACMYVYIYAHWLAAWTDLPKLPASFTPQTILPNLVRRPPPNCFWSGWRWAGVIWNLVEGSTQRQQ